MFSRRFAAWVGVGLLSVATIPAVAAPHLARYTARTRPAAKTPVAKVAVKPAKAVAKAPAKHETKAVVAVKPAVHAAAVKKAAQPAKAVTAPHPRAKSATKGHRPTRLTAHKAVASNPSHASAPATAKKLFH